MKKLTVIILAVCMLLTSCAPAANTALLTTRSNEQAVPAAALNAGEQPDFSTLEYTSDEVGKLPSAPSFDYAFSAPGSQWRNLAANDTPAAFSQVSYEFVDDVLEVGQTVTDSIASAGQLMSGNMVQRLQPNQIIAQGGYVSRSILDAAAAQKGRTVENGTVVVDKAAGVAFKVVAPTAFYDGSEQSEYLERLEGTYSVATPQLHEILKDFSLGGNNGETEEMVTVTRGNITGFAPNMEANLVDDNGVKLMSYADSYKGYKDVLTNYLVNLQFDNVRLDAFLGDGSPIKVTVSGGIAVENIGVYGRYTFCRGYALAMTVRQESYLVVEMEAELAEEITIPLFGIDAGVGDVGRVTGGLFAIIGLDGRLRVEVYAREYTSIRVGLRGKTAAYVPISVRPTFDKTIKFDGDVNLTGKINGSLKFGPMLGIEIFGFDLIGAGAFLGTGVSVEKNDTLLDVKLYGILQVYVKLLGKKFNLANLTPTIFRKTQQDTAGYVVDIFEAYVYPGRVSGTIKKELPEPGEEAKSISYRVWVVPGGVSFDTNNANDLNNPKIRKYPKDGYASTLEGGVFFQEDKDMLSAGDRVYLEFKVDGKSLFSSPASPTLPFTDYIITHADYFNGYVTGQVQPLRLINWNTGKNEWAYYANQQVKVCPQLCSSQYPHSVDNPLPMSFGGHAYVRTDEYGNFDTRDEFISDTGEAVPDWKFDFFPVPPDKMQHYLWEMRLVLNYRDGDREATVSGEAPFTPASSLYFTRVIREVVGSYKRYEEGERIIDQMAYDEYIWVVNPDGTRTVGDGTSEYMTEHFGHITEAFSTQDLRGLPDYTIASEQERSVLWAGDVYGADNAYKNPKPLEPVLDANGSPTGAALYAQRVTVEWVWQEHKNPVKITSAATVSKKALGGTFQVTADGYAPFAFSLTGAPAGVVIDKDTGLITVPAGLPKNEYTFTIRAEENRPYMSRIDTYIKYEGNDPSPPDEQAFTLKITELTVMPEPSPTPPSLRMAPVIAEEEHEYAFKKVSGISETNIQINAAGSEPITWSLVPTDRYPLPEGVTIDPETGILTIAKFMTQGRHFFTIQAENDVGSDTQECRLEVMTFTRDDTPAIKGFGGLSSVYERGGSIALVYADSLASAFTPIWPTEIHPPVTQDGRSQYGFLFQEDGFDTEPYLFEMITPSNTVTIRYDDPRDIYTNDRWTVNGAAFVRWQSCPHVYTLWNENTWSWWWAKTGDMLLDTSPRCDNYHFRVPSDLEAFIARRIEDYNKKEIDLDLIFGSGDNMITIPPRTHNATYLEYGTMLGKINSQKGGSFRVELDQTTGATITGKYFVSLMGNKSAKLSFIQDGAAVTFAGKDISAAKEYEFFDFTYYSGSFFESDMLAGVGPDDKNFIFGFRHHGELPGMAVFAITTEIAEGTNVNVYDFDPETGAYTLVAAGVDVGKGGVLTYKNNSMSEYLVTTKTLEGASVSDVAGQQGSGGGNIWLFIGIGLAVLLCGAAVIVVVRRRGRPGTSQ
ncbi:MAG: hypothetical protein GXY20_08310 [Clostridiales bacterium]|nr:hypothetical protein [Clostridiales bacterium]